MNPIWHGVFALVLSYVSFLSLSDKNDTMWLLPRTFLISSQTPLISPIGGPESVIHCDSISTCMPLDSPKPDPADISAHVTTSIMSTVAHAATPSNPYSITEATPVYSHLLEEAMNETSIVLVKAAFWLRYNVFQRVLLFAQVMRAPQFDEPLIFPPSTTESIFAHSPTPPVVSLDENRVLVDRVVSHENTNSGNYLFEHWIQMLVALSTVVLILYKLYNFASTLISSLPGTSSTHVVGVCFDNESYHWHGQLDDLLQASSLIVGNASLASASTEYGALGSDQLQYHVQGRVWTLFGSEETEISIWSHDWPPQVVDSSGSTKKDIAIERATVSFGPQGLLTERRDPTSTGDEPPAIALFSDVGHSDLAAGASNIQTEEEDDPAKGIISSVRYLIPPIEPTQTTSSLTSLSSNSTPSSTLRTSLTLSSAPLADRIKFAVASANALCIERRGLPNVRFEYARQERLRDPEAMAAWRTAVAEISESCGGDGITRSERRALRKLQLQREALQQQQVA